MLISYVILFPNVFSFTSNTSVSTYQIGICSAPNSSNPNAAIIQKESQNLYILGQLNQVNLVEGGFSYKIDFNYRISLFQRR